MKSVCSVLYAMVFGMIVSGLMAPLLCTHVSLLTSLIEVTASQYGETATMLYLLRSIDVGDGIRKTGCHDAVAEQTA